MKVSAHHEVNLRLLLAEAAELRVDRDAVCDQVAPAT